MKLIQDKQPTNHKQLAPKFIFIKSADGKIPKLFDTIVDSKINPRKGITTKQYNIKAIYKDMFNSRKEAEARELMAEIVNNETLGIYTAQKMMEVTNPTHVVAVNATLLHDYDHEFFFSIFEDTQLYGAIYEDGLLGVIHNGERYVFDNMYDFNIFMART